MVLGLDYNGVLTSRPNELRKLCKHFDEVYVVSVSNTPRGTRMRIRGLMLNAKIIILPFRGIGYVPQDKLKVCREKGINVFIDDMPQVCTLLNKHNILGLCLTTTDLNR